jgi:anti-sigma regulatory factor (Ser/Thr protein kinase)
LLSLLEDTGPFRHPAFFYDSAQMYVDCLAPFVTEALDVGQAVLVAVPGPNLAMLKSALGDTAATVTWVDITDEGRNPGAILPGVLSRFADRFDARPVCIIGEPVWDGRSDLEYPACVQHEALINQAFVGRAITVVCPYDENRLSQHHLADALSTHPVLWRSGVPETSSADFAPHDAWQRYNQPLAKGVTAVDFTVRKLGDLKHARAFAAAYGKWFGCTEDRSTDLQLVVSELASESLMYSTGPCHLAFWHQGSHLVCEARDNGPLDDPLAWLRLDPVAGARGVGLMVVNAIADLVRCHTGPDGTTVHAYLRVQEGQ